MQPPILRSKSLSCTQTPALPARAGAASEDTSNTTAINEKLRIKTHLGWPLARASLPETSRSSKPPTRGRVPAIFYRQHMALSPCLVATQPHQHNTAHRASLKHWTDRSDAVQGRAAVGRYSRIGNRRGQCLVSDGFETRIGKADKAKPIQTKKIAIHTLGHQYAFSVPLNRVGLPAMNRHLRPSVDYLPVTSLDSWIGASGITRITRQRLPQRFL